MKRALGLIGMVIAIAVVSAQLEALPDWVESMRQAHPFLLRTFLRIHVWQWMGLAILAFVALLMGIVVSGVFMRLTKFHDALAATPIEEPTRLAISRASGLMLGSLFAGMLLTDLALHPVYLADLQMALNCLALIGGILFLYGWWDVLCDSIASRAAGHERAERLLVPMTRKLVRAAIIVCGCLAAVALFGGTKTIATMVGTLGIGGLVVALAAKDSVENLFGSFTIMFDMPFAIGDWVKIAPVEGTVEQINLRSTRLRTAEDTIILLPNANLIRASVENFGSRRFRRMKLTFRLSYDCKTGSIDSYIEELKQFIATRPEIVSDKTEIVLVDPQEQSVGLLVDCRLEVATYSEELAARHRVIEEALRLRANSGVMFTAAPRAKEPDEPETSPTAEPNTKPQ